MNWKTILSSVRKLPVKRILLVILLLYIAALVVPYIPHKKVSETFQKHFQTRTFYQKQTGTERVAYINDNTDALLCRLRMIEEAEDEIIVSTFDFNADKAGKDMMSALLCAADRGVSVKVIVDGCSGFLDMRGNEWFQALTAHENVEMRIYNPVNLLKPWTLQARMHDKYVICDRKIYLLGGRNTVNLFLGDYSSSKNIDRELLIYEPDVDGDSSVNQLLSYFDTVWNRPESKEYLCKDRTKEVKDCAEKLKKRREQLMELYPEAYREWDWNAYTMETNQVSLLYNPVEAANKEPWMWYSLNQLMQNGKQVTVYTPYIICGKEMYQDLENLRDSDVSVEIITNDVASGANPWGCTDYLNQKEKIHATGVKVYEFMGKHSCHTKAVLIDDRMSIVGSYNMDMRSTYQDTELMLAVDSKELNAVIREEAERDRTYSKTAEEDGTYSYGENYEAKELSTGKKVFYGVLRVVTIPLRRFL